MATTAARRAVPTLGLLTASGLTLAYTLPRPRHRCDSYSNPTFAQGFSLINPTTWRFFHSQQPPPPPPPPPPAAFKTTFNPTHYRQISSGSFLGLFAGLAVARFSRPLAVIAGLLVCIVEFLAMKGIQIIPYQRLERWQSDLNYKSAILDNVAFKIAFGAAFSVAAAASW